MSEPGKMLRLIIVQTCMFYRLISLVVSQSQPVFDDTTTNVTAKEGETARLSCLLESHTDLKFQLMWMDMNRKLLISQVLRDDPRLSVSQGSLQIDDVKYSDQGQYTCQINTQPVKNKTVHLFVQGPPKIVNPSDPNPLNLKFNEGNKLYLHCTVTGQPQPIITWYFTDEYTDMPATKEKVGEGEDFFVYNVGRNSSGLYECQASNVVGTAVSRFFDVFIFFPPEVLRPLKREDQIEDNATILKCQVTAFPTASIMWKKGEFVIASQADKYTLDTKNVSYFTRIISLRIDDLQPEDYDKYTCWSKNTLGQAESSIVLYGPPQIVNPSNPEPLKFKLNEGDTLKLNCTATGQPKPSIVWYFTSQYTNKERVGEGEVYFISGVRRNSSGLYECQANNGVGTPVSRFFDISISHISSSGQPATTPATCTSTISIVIMLIITLIIVMIFVVIHKKGKGRLRKFTPKEQYL